MSSSLLFLILGCLFGLLFLLFPFGFFLGSQYFLTGIAISIAVAVFKRYRGSDATLYAFASLVVSVLITYLCCFVFKQSPAHYGLALSFFVIDSVVYLVASTLALRLSVRRS